MSNSDDRDVVDNGDYYEYCVGNQIWAVMIYRYVPAGYTLLDTKWRYEFVRQRSCDSFPNGKGFDTARDAVSTAFTYVEQEYGPATSGYGKYQPAKYSDPLPGYQT